VMFVLAVDGGLQLHSQNNERIYCNRTVSHRITERQQQHTKMNSTSCVSDIIDYYVDGMVHSPCSSADDSDLENVHHHSPSTDESDAESVHHQLVGRWFRDRFFLPRPYQSTSFFDDEDNIHNDIIDDGPSDRSMALFSDNLVSKEIRSSIVTVSDDDDSSFLRHQYKSSPKGLSGSEYIGFSDKREQPPEVVMVLDGSPLFPLDNEGNDERRHAESKCEDEEYEKICCPKISTGFIHRTFSFDEHLPIVHRRGAASIRTLSKSIDEDDYYSEEQLSFTIPVTYSNDASRSKFLYPISM